ncbi:hypothetical protein LCGC14_1204840 [marine sediment metagenome]|uniref:DNA topoisomerase n=1 Tax=marine sediment metagenome TaxID=412755 RepID=A0A0F9NY90_9ZZZZ
MLISKRAGVKSDQPAYKKKEKSPSGKGDIYRYDEKHISKRWDIKKSKLKKLEKEIEKVRTHYRKDLKSDDEKTRAIAAIVGLMDYTAIRIGNEDSAKEGTYGATTLKVKHVKGGSGNMTFDFPGKGAIEQNVVLKNNEVIKVIRDLMKGKKANDFIFEIDGKKIWDRTVNRYLDPLGISAKDLRGFHSNRLMKEQLKKKDFKDALEEVAEIVGHEPATLKNQYLDPELVEKYEGKDKDKKNDKKKKKAGLSIRAIDPESKTEETMSIPPGSIEPITFTPEDARKMVSPISTDPLANAPAVNTLLNVGNVHRSARVPSMLVTAWQILAPFLPPGSRLRNSNRTWREQRIIIRDYWANKRWRTVGGKRSQYIVAAGTGFFATMFPNVAKIDGSVDVMDIQEEELQKAQMFMTQAYNSRKKIEFAGKTRSVWKANGPWSPLKIAWKKSKHIGGNAIDIDGAPLKNIEQSVAYVMNEPSLAQYISIGGTVYEPDQGNFHVNVVGATPIPKEVHESALRNHLHGYPLVSMVTTQCVDKPAISKRALLTPEDAQWIRMEKNIRPIKISPRERVNRRISKKVTPNQLILDAWEILRSFFPEDVKETALLTSGSRTSEDQIRIINNLDTKHPDVENPYKRSKLLIGHGWVVGPPTSKGRDVHLTGRAFDVSGANLYEIADVARKISRNPRIPVTFSQVKVEDKNNAVHIGIKNVASDGKTTTSISKIANEEIQIKEMYEDLLVSHPQSEVSDEFENTFGLNHLASFKEYFADDGGDDLGLQKDYPDLEESAGAARNIKDPNKVELEQPEWIKKDQEQSISLRDRNARKNISKRAKKDKPKAGVFMKLPRELAKQFPSLGEHDDSIPHITALFIGLVPEKHEILLEEIVKRVAMEHDPFELSLDGKVSYFPATKHSDDCKIAKLSVISTGLIRLHNALKKAITNAKMDIDDHFPGYKPHVTLEYMAPPKEKYDSELPSGSWTADKIEIWNGNKKITIPLGRKKKASLSARAFNNNNVLVIRDM